MAESEEPNLPADGQPDALQTKAEGQVLRGTTSDPAGADQVRHAQVALEKQRDWDVGTSWR